MDKKIAIVMSGGAAKGSREMGCLLGLRELGVLNNVDAYYGTSVGALNTAAMATVGLDELENIWDNIKSRSDVLKLKWWTLGPCFGPGVFSTSPLRKKINQLLKHPPVCNGTVCWVDLKDGKTKYSRITDVDFAQATEASATMPVIMSNKLWNHVDGGVREISPLGKAIKDGYEDIIVILASPWEANPNNYEKPSFFGMGLKILARTLDIMNHEVFINDIKLCIARNKDPKYKKINIKIYAPKDDFVDPMKFEQINIQHGKKQGQQMAYDGPIKYDK